MTTEKLDFDEDTKKWFEEHPGIRETVRQCHKCGLWYIPEVGHKKCKGE